MPTRTSDADILLVEDNKGDAKLVMMAFKQSKPDKKLVWVDTGEKALEYLMCVGEYSWRDKSARPSLILLDLTLPKISGFEVLRSIKNDSALAAIEIVVLTGSQNEADLVKSYGYGVKTYIRKQIAAQNCIRVICGEGKEKDIEKILTEAYGENGDEKGK